MNRGDSAGIVTLYLAIYLAKWENGHQDHLLRKVKKSDQKKTVIAR
jgi:hypothetical protein